MAEPAQEAASADVELLQLMLDDAREHIRFLRATLGALRGAGEIKVQRWGKLPTRAYDGDAGYDLYVHADTVIEGRSFCDVDLGVAVQFPTGVWSMLTGRSSTLRQRGLLVTQGIIDCGYRGPLFAGVYNLGEQEVRLQAGERIAQLIPFLHMGEAWHIREVDALDESDRGQRGFGSTGS